MKIKSSYRKPARRLSRRSDNQSFFGSDSESDHPPFFTPGSEVRAKDEGATFQGKTPEEEVSQAKDEEEETAQAKEEEEETMQAKEEEEEAQPKGIDEKGSSDPSEKCACGGTGKEGEPDEQPESGPAPGQAKDGADSPSLAYQKCDTITQEPSIKQAVSSATSLANRAAGASTAIAMVGGLQAQFPGIKLTQGELHHQKWFGKFHQSRAHRIARTYRKISKALTGKIYVSCGCKKNIYAYVKAGGQRKIFLCKKFWGAGSSGFDSRPGVIVHELAHEVDLSIGDKGYGTNKAEKLAKKKPGKAATNADNYEYYAESL